ncbi:hypothetical protein E2562_034001 [Oryza meyeriana var. granulata]|uniref:Uncharacterized protein n=1 Tax=Oryza meyeriana var. granulata TaxID=110450 RepID=A0A6G1ES74_9ORYZ|nr:hypothetical protein E2562_034001 [Oryza meyeriana var. granulata]
MEVGPIGVARREGARVWGRGGGRLADREKRSEGRGSYESESESEEGKEFVGGGDARDETWERWRDKFTGLPPVGFALRSAAMRLLTYKLAFPVPSCALTWTEWPPSV